MKNLLLFSIIPVSLIFTTTLIVGCSKEKSPPAVKGLNEEDLLHWTERFDLDGDGQADKISYVYTGNKHCCYRLSIKLTSNLRDFHLPFELDGGYVDGLDLSQPNRFDIKKNPDGTAEMIMEIHVFGGVAKPIPKLWTEIYGVKTHYVSVSFPGGAIMARDYPRQSSAIDNNLMPEQSKKEIN